MATGFRPRTRRYHSLYYWGLTARKNLMFKIARAFLFLNLLFLGPTYAITPVIPHISGEVLEEGIAIILGQIEDKAAPNTAAGRTSMHEELRFIKRTLLVPATLGTVFGYRYRLVGLPMRGELSLEMRVVHPPMKGLDGRERTVDTNPFQVETLDGLYENDIVYLLSEPFEVVPGKWALQILYQGRVLVSREFVLE